MAEELLLPLTVVILLCTVLPARSQGELPEGDGRKAVQTHCVWCHDFGPVTRSGYSEQGWRNAIHMIINVGATLPKDQIALATKYLAKDFPERPRPGAVVIPGALVLGLFPWLSGPVRPCDRPGDRVAPPVGPSPSRTRLLPLLCGV
jgi:hypothetical protein